MLTKLKPLDILNSNIAIGPRLYTKDDPAGGKSTTPL